MDISLDWSVPFSYEPDPRSFNRPKWNWSERRGVSHIQYAPWSNGNSLIRMKRCGQRKPPANYGVHRITFSLYTILRHLSSTDYWRDYVPNLRALPFECEVRRCICNAKSWDAISHNGLHQVCAKTYKENICVLAVRLPVFLGDTDI